MKEKIIKYKVEKSLFPEDNKTHLVVKYSSTEYGRNIQRIFKGTFKECEEEKNRLWKSSRKKRI